MMLESSAIFSNDRVFRYVLTRIWSLNEKPCMFIGLNPSTADEINNDPTVSRCIKFAFDLGYGGLHMMNAFAFRSTDPKKLYEIQDPVGPENDYWLERMGKTAGMIIGVWGNHGKYLERYKRLLALFPSISVFGITKEKQPRHPLYLRADLYPISYQQALDNPNFIPIRNNGQTRLF